MTDWLIHSLTHPPDHLLTHLLSDWSLCLFPLVASWLACLYRRLPSSGRTVSVKVDNINSQLIDSRWLPWQQEQYPNGAIPRFLHFLNSSEHSLCLQPLPAWRSVRQPGHGCVHMHLQAWVLWHQLSVRSVHLHLNSHFWTPFQERLRRSKWHSWFSLNI